MFLNIQKISYYRAREQGKVRRAVEEVNLPAFSVSLLSLIRAPEFPPFPSASDACHEVLFDPATQDRSE